MSEVILIDLFCFFFFSSVNKFSLFYLDNDVFIGNDVGYELRKLVAVEYTVGVCLYCAKWTGRNPRNKTKHKKKK